MLTQDDIIYFVLTDRFANGDTENDFDVDPNNPNTYHGGDFQGIIDRLPYLQNLGVTALWITPVYENTTSSFNGYSPYHYYWPLHFNKVDKHLYSPKPGIPEGSPRYFKEFVDQVHAAGMKVVMDVVVNHTGYDHPSLTDPDFGPIKPHWFNPPKHDEHGPIGTWLAGLPDLKLDEPEVADYFARNIADWIDETGVDCIRMDTARHVEGIFWQYYKTVVKGPHPTVSLLGEVLDYTIENISQFQQQFAFDSLFDFPLQGAIERAFIHGESLEGIAAAFNTWEAPGHGILDRDISYTNHNKLVTLLDNHDLHARFFTSAMWKSEGDREWAQHTLMLAMTFLMTTRGIPQIYYGTELMLEGGGDPDNRRDMPWHLLPDGLAPSTRDHPAEAAVFNHTKQLINIRKASTALKYGSHITLYSSHRLMVYLREFRDEWAVIAINLHDHDMTEALHLPLHENPMIPPRVKEAMARQQYVDIHRHIPAGYMTDQVLSIQMPARSSSILIPLKQLLVNIA
jgi:alpha-amylase